MKMWWRVASRIGRSGLERRMDGVLLEYSSIHSLTGLLFICTFDVMLGSEVSGVVIGMDSHVSAIPDILGIV
jgi:hypothetical protein